MARAMYKGVIVFGDVSLPVKLYAAVEPHATRFRLLHADDHTPLRREMVDPTSGEPVEDDETRRGLEIRDGVFVILGDDELAEVEPAPTRDIEVRAFLDASAIDEPWYSRPYWVGPDGHEDEYAALVEALSRANAVGVAHWTMRKRSYVGVLRAFGDHLGLVALRHADEVLAVGQLPRPTGAAASEAERGLAEQLVQSLTAELDLSRHHDDYRERLAALVQAKAEGKTVELPPPRPRETAGSLSEALRRSLDAAEDKDVA